MLGAGGGAGELLDPCDSGKRDLREAGVWKPDWISARAEKLRGHPSILAEKCG